MRTSNVISGGFTDFARLSKLVNDPTTFVASPALEAQLDIGMVSLPEIDEGIRTSNPLPGRPSESVGQFSVRNETYYWKIWAQERPKGLLGQIFTPYSKREVVDLNEMHEDKNYDEVILVSNSAEFFFTPVCKA